MKLLGIYFSCYTLMLLFPYLHISLSFAFYLFAFCFFFSFSRFSFFSCFPPPIYRFLDQLHANHYRLYNLYVLLPLHIRMCTPYQAILTHSRCLEGKYDYEKFKGRGCTSPPLTFSSSLLPLPFSLRHIHRSYARSGVARGLKSYVPLCPIGYI
jgi:hypothetical protein